MLQVPKPQVQVQVPSTTSLLKTESSKQLAPVLQMTMAYRNIMELQYNVGYYMHVLTQMIVSHVSVLATVY